MERYKSFKRIVILLCIVTVINCVFLAFLMPSFNLWSVSVIVIQLIVTAYFSTLVIGMAKLLRKYEEKSGKINE